jgi:predicted kinase
MKQQLIQMSGVPGSGKSTISTAIREMLGAIVIDNDDTKSAILSKGIENNLSGQASYEVIKVLVDRFLSDGHTVVIDSPCLYQGLLDFGQSQAIKYQVPYRYIECRLTDMDELNRRIESRHGKPSQVKTLNQSFRIHGKGDKKDAREVFKEWANDMKRPENDFLVIDSRLPLQKCIGLALEYVAT